MFKKYATWNQVERQLEKLARRIDTLEIKTTDPSYRHTYNAMVNILEEAGILMEIKNPTQVQVSWNNKIYKIKKVK